MPKIFLLNGPPRAGKDTAANYLASKFQGDVMKFAAPLKDGCTAVFCDNNRGLFNTHDSAENKDVQNEQFLGKSCRQAQIDMSESYLKPIYGQNVFGKILAEKIDKDHNGMIFVSDSGFEPEAKELVKKFGVQNVILIKILRDGYTYEGDRRNYIELTPCDTHIVKNEDHKQSAFFAELDRIVTLYQ